MSKRSLLIVALVLFAAALAPAQPAKAQNCDPGCITYILLQSCQNNTLPPAVMPGDYFKVEIHDQLAPSRTRVYFLGYAGASGVYRIYKYQTTVAVPSNYFFRHGISYAPWGPWWGAYVGPYTLVQGGLLNITSYRYSSSESGCP